MTGYSRFTAGGAKPEVLKRMLAFTDGYLLALEDIRKDAEEDPSLGPLRDHLDYIEDAAQQQKNLLIQKLERAQKEGR